MVEEIREEGWAEAGPSPVWLGWVPSCVALVHPRLHVGSCMQSAAPDQPCHSDWHAVGWRRVFAS